MKQETTNTSPSTTFKLRAYSPRQLSELYEVSTKTFRRWLQPIEAQIGERQGRYYNISQVKCILQHLGIPGNTLAE
jgi:transposase